MIETLEGLRVQCGSAKRSADFKFPNLRALVDNRVRQRANLGYQKKASH